MIISLHSFMSHHSTTVELPDRGLVVVTGPNGAGKSALVEAVSYAAWGRGARSARWSPWRGEEPGAVVVQGGGVHVRREWTGKSKRLKWRADEAQEFDTTAKAQEALEHVVGPYEAWRRTSLFSAADAAHFTMSTDAERKELLEQLLGLTWFETALQLCRRDLHSARTQLGQVERDGAVLAAGMEAKAKALREAQALLDTTAAPEDVGLLRAELARVDKHLQDTSREYLAADRRRSSLHGAGSVHRGLATEAQARLKRLAEDRCYTCGQHVPDSLRDELRRKMAEETEASDRAREEVAADLAQLDEECSELTTLAEGLRPIVDEHRDRLSKLEEQRRIRSMLRKQVEALGREVAEGGGQGAVLMNKLQQLKVDVAELEACERVLGTRGVRAHLIGETLSGVTQLANAWMVRLRSEVRVTLSPYTERKSGAVADAISLTLHGAGGESGYLGASAGERRRVDVSLLMALSELSVGSGSRAWETPLFFDEVFDSLDEQGREATLDAVEELAERRCVVLITHDAALAQGRSSVRLQVDGGRVT